MEFDDTGWVNREQAPHALSCCVSWASALVEGSLAPPTIDLRCTCLLTSQFLVLLPGESLSSQHDPVHRRHVAHPAWRGLGQTFPYTRLLSKRPRWESRGDFRENGNPVYFLGSCDSANEVLLAPRTSHPTCKSQAVSV